MIRNSKFNRGISLVEIIVAISIFLVAVTSLLAVYSFFVRIGTTILSKIQTSYLLEEGIEAMTSIRDYGWNTNIASLTTGKEYYLAWVDGRWTTTTTASKIDNVYTRSVMLSDVKRDSNDNISESGTLDPNTKKVTVSVNYNPLVASSGASAGSPDAPSFMSTTSTCVWATDVVVAGTYAFVICKDRIQVYDVVNPSIPVLVSTAMSSGNSTTPFQGFATISGNYLYVTVMNVNRLDIYDISNKSNLVRVGQVTTGFQPSGVVVSGSYAYLVNEGSNTLQTVNVSNPASPTIVNTKALITHPKYIMISSGYLYVFNGEGTNDGWLQIFNLTNPAVPSIVGTTSANTFANYPKEGYLYGGYLYSAAPGYDGFQITRISNPSTPTVVYTLPGFTMKRPTVVAGRGAYIYIAIDSPSDVTKRAIQVWSLANPTLPTYVRSLALSQSDYLPNAITTSGSYMYLTSGFDNSQPGTLKIYGIGADTSTSSASNNVIGTTKTLSTYITNLFNN